MSDRIYVMNGGRMIAEIPGKEATQEKIMSYIINSEKGASKQASSAGSDK